MNLLVFLSFFILSIYLLVFAVAGIGYILSRRFVNKSNFDLKLIKITILVSVRNEMKNIATLYNSLASIDYPKDSYEVIVIDDFSSDDTLSYCYDLHTRLNAFDMSIYSLSHDTKQGKKYALDIGISKAKYNTIVTTDADCTHHSLWLKRINESLIKNPNAMLIGEVDIKTTDNSFLTWLQYFETSALQFLQIGFAQLKKPLMSNGANFVFNKRLFQSVNGYQNMKTASGDDVFLLESFIKNKYPIKALSFNQSRVITNPKKTLKTLLHQKIRWSSKVFLQQKSVRLIASVVILTNLFNLILVFNFENVFIGYFIAKLLIDTLILFIRDRKIVSKMPFILLSQLLYPFYLIIIIYFKIVSKEYIWKNRKHKL